MPRHQKPGTARIDLDISVEAKLRFATLHESLGFKTKSETFEAILYFVWTKDKIDPAVMERMEQKLDHSSSSWNLSHEKRTDFRPQIHRPRTARPGISR